MGLSSVARCERDGTESDLDRDLGFRRLGDMEALPDDILANVIGRVGARNGAALVCRRWHELDRRLRRELVVAACPPEAGLAALCARFCNLTTVEINHLGWKSEMGKQVDDGGLKTLATGCAHLADLSLNFCTFVTDAGMAALANNARLLRALRLNFTPCVSGRGLLSLVSGCSALALLHITRLVNMRALEWLEFAGRNRSIESLAIRNCRGLSDAELVRLGCRGWRHLREFAFEMDVVHRPTGDFFGHNGRSVAPLNGWRAADPEEKDLCPDLKTLSLVNCLSMSGTGVAWVLSQCRALRSVTLDSCMGVSDEDLIALTSTSAHISSISLRVPSGSRVTDLSLFAIARDCQWLETLVLGFQSGGSVSPPRVTAAGIAAVAQGCPRLRLLALHRVAAFSDEAMAAVCRSGSLEVLRLSECHAVTDAGLSMVARSRLRELSIRACFRATDEWLAPLKVSNALACLEVVGCQQISHEAVLGASQVVHYDGEVDLLDAFLQWSRSPVDTR